MIEPGSPDFYYPGFSPCGKIVGVLRNCYSNIVRWYPGDGLGRIRYYFVPWSNGIFEGNNAFFPQTVDLDKVWDNPVGEPSYVYSKTRAAGKAWWEDGTYFSITQPSFNDPPHGSAADFAGQGQALGIVSPSTYPICEVQEAPAPPPPPPPPWEPALNCLNAAPRTIIAEVIEHPGEPSNEGFKMVFKLSGIAGGGAQAIYNLVSSPQTDSRFGAGAFSLSCDPHPSEPTHTTYAAISIWDETITLFWSSSAFWTPARPVDVTIDRQGFPLSPQLWPIKIRFFEPIFPAP